ncbi:hypothetical protein M9H77_12367 [Catharanthus roseus]|uniref:Uncharacterized protein n=1 Tax=Catharanthus roseus TaxID=4058 RepID=A0ACC0BHC3_CATRO|nr:hypothetical protein M9H77_12367 [Catharanthus roseus]
MDYYEEFVEENIGLENGVDLSIFEEFLEPEEYLDHGHLFATDRIFNSKPELVNWAKETAIKSRTSDCRSYVTLGCERGGANKPRKKPVVDDEEEEVQVKRSGPYGTKKCGCSFKVKGEQMTMCENWQATTYRWILQQIKHLYFSNTMSTENQEDVCETMPKLVNGSWKKLLDKIDEQEYLRKLDVLKTKWKSKPDFLHYLFNNWLNPFAHEFMRCWTKSHMYFGMETTNRAESEHSVLKLWLSICHDDLDTVFFNIDSLIKGQIADIKALLEFSKTKEKNNAKSYHIFYIISNKIIQLVLKKIWSEITRAVGIYDDPKRVLNPVLSEDPSVTLTSPPEVAVTKRRKKTNSTKRDKSHWDYVSIAHRKIQKSRGSVSDSGTGSGLLPGSGSCSGSRGRGRPPRAPRERGRGCDHGRSSLSAVIRASPCSTFPYTNAFPAFIYPFISNWKNVISDGNCGYQVVADFVFGDEHQWPDVS